MKYFKLTQQQQEVIDVVVTQVEDSRGYLEQGGKEITQAIDYRVSSRKKLWWIFGIIVVLLVVLALVVYLKRCEWLGVQCTPPAAPGK